MPSDPAPQAPAQDDRRTMAPGFVVATLTLLLGIQPITTDLYLPALPRLQHDLAASIAATQLTLSALIICFGFGQLACGPLADRFGRRPVLLVGLALYVVAAVFSALATTIDALIVWRSLQGAAMAAAVTCARSVVRDLYAPHEGARVTSRALSGLGVIAMTSPLLGGVLTQWFDWHAALLALSVYGALALGVVAWRFEETAPRLDPRATRLRPLLANWRGVLGHPTFRAWAALSMCSYGGLFLVLASSSFVYIEVLGLTRIGYGLTLAANSFAYIVGTVWCRRLLLRHGLRGAVQRGAWASLAGGVGMAAFSLAGVHTVWAVLLPQLLFAVGHGVHQPCGQVGSVGPFPEKAGTAASLSGFTMMAAAFGIGLWLGRSLDGTVYPLTLGLAACSFALVAVAWTLVRRDGEARVVLAPSV